MQFGGTLFFAFHMSRFFPMLLSILQKHDTEWLFSILFFGSLHSHRMDVLVVFKFVATMNNAQVSIFVHKACVSIWVLPQGRLGGAELLGKRV